MSEARCQALVEDQTEVITRFTPDGNFTFVNEAYCRLVGKRREDLVGISLFKDIPEHEIPTLRKYFNTFSPNRPHQSNKHYITNASGELCNFQWSYSVTFDEQGKITEILCLGRDTTERKPTDAALWGSSPLWQQQIMELQHKKEVLEAQVTNLAKFAVDISTRNDELVKLNDQKNKFFSIIAHDLKSPFNGLLSFTNILKTMANTSDPENVIKYASIVHQSGQEVFKLLENLLEWAQLQMGKVDFERGPVNLRETIKSNVALFAPVAEEKKIQLIKHGDQPLVVLADAAMVDSILRNLINNAIKFTHTGGTVTVQADQNGDGVDIKITDTGVGMSTVKVDKLFKLDQMNSSTGTGGETGTGLGLLLCKELVEIQGGQIKVESIEGKGSTFHVRLPLYHE